MYEELVASGNSETENKVKKWTHNLYISTNYVLHMEKVFSIVRQRSGVSPTDRMKNLDMNEAIWKICMSVTLQAAVHFGKDYRKSAVYQESTQEILETVISSDCEVYHGSDRNYWTDYD